MRSYDSISTAKKAKNCPWGKPQTSIILYQSPPNVQDGTPDHLVHVLAESPGSSGSLDQQNHWLLGPIPQTLLQDLDRKSLFLLQIFQLLPIVQTLDPLPDLLSSDEC
eukprot:CAMPEP_0184304096 /NCGR_PEP_ID=MMETSP1049-20130417/13713_1 /TAXON_ID=77928 /ORGANISM="Proteomonas sulcata, Strain CCMP704" /LENGTH=107 /DNA_ID=CAMNT_0026615835 /DNA_START=332 /DNA_END=655 /DNA_ORIENTATION=-